MLAWMLSLRSRPSCAALVLSAGVCVGGGKGGGVLIKVTLGAVVDGGNLGGRAAKHLGLPRIQVAVKVDNGDRAVLAVDGAQDG